MHGCRVPSEYGDGCAKPLGGRKTVNTMLESLLRLSGSGRLPTDGCRLVESDRDSFTAESIVGSITFRNFRSPGRYSSWRRQWFLGSLAVTNNRIVAYRQRSRLVNIPFDDPRIGQMEFSGQNQDCLSIRHDASLFHPSWTGDIEIRFTTIDAQYMLSLIESGIHDLCCG